METPSGATVQPEIVQQQTVYFMVQNSGFAVGSDQQTLFSIRHEADEVDWFVCRQNLQTGGTDKFGRIDHDFLTITMTLDEDRDVLFVIGQNVSAKSVQINKYNPSTGDLIKVLTLPDLSGATNAFLIGNYCLLGCGDHVLKAFDLDTCQSAFDPVAIAVELVYTFELCRVVDSSTAKAQFVLALGGDSPDYSDAKTDLFDVTGLVVASQSEELSRLSQLSQKNLRIRALEHKIAEARREHRRQLDPMKSLLSGLPQLKVGVL